MGEIGVPGENLPKVTDKLYPIMLYRVAKETDNIFGSTRLFRVFCPWGKGWECNMQAVLSFVCGLFSMLFFICL